MVRRYCTIARLARITMSASTTINSMMVKPPLPVLVFRPIEPCPLRRRVDVEDVLPPPRGGVGVVLVRAHPPLGRLGHRVNGNAPEEFDLAAGHVVRRRHAFDERLEVGRISLAAGLDLER